MLPTTVYDLSVISTSTYFSTLNHENRLCMIKNRESEEKKKEEYVFLITENTATHSIGKNTL